MIAGTISIPWLGEKTMDFLGVLASVLQKIPKSFGRWLLFIDTEQSSGVGRKISSFSKRYIIVD